MREFNGFLDDAKQMVPIPAQFFQNLLTEIDDLVEMRVTLFALGMIAKSGDFGNSLLMQDFTRGQSSDGGAGQHSQEAQTGLLDGLELAVQRGSTVAHRRGGYPQPADRTLSEHSARPTGSPGTCKCSESLPVSAASVINTNKEKPNLFALYEANLGPLTPMIADTLREAEKVYPPEWVEEAMKIAVQNNIRRWRYVEAILKSWKEEGRHGGDQQNPKEDYRRYVKGKYGKFVKH